MKIRSLALAAVAAAFLAACGGGGDDDRSPRVDYSKAVVFGDSLSDVGSYATPGVVALGGGRYTINSADAKIWVDLVAAAADVAEPCAAQTGLQSSGALADLAAAVENHDDCFGYAQGGARVTQPIGPSNAALLAGGNTSGYLGQLTVPISTQIDNHLAKSSAGFDDDDLVLVLGGGNDLFMNLATLQATVAGGGDATAAATAAVAAMGTAGAELAAYVKTKILANGAPHVVVVNLPDVSRTPFAYEQDANTRALVEQMSASFNEQLAAGLDGEDDVLLVDASTDNRNHAEDPAKYGLTNVTDTACDLSVATLGSLSCNSSTLIEGDTSRYKFADTVHPTPYGHKLLAQLVTESMQKRGWL